MAADSKLSEAVGLLGFDDSPEKDGPSESEGGQLAASEDVIDALESKDPKRLIRAMRELVELL